MVCRFSFVLLLLALAVSPALTAENARTSDPPYEDTWPVRFEEGTAKAGIHPLARRFDSIQSPGPVGITGWLAVPLLQAEMTVVASGPSVVVAFNDDRGPASWTGAVYSTDGGATFHDAGTMPTIAGSQVFGDPALAVWEPPTGPAVFYLASLFFTPTTRTICIHRSTDGGATWQGPFEVTAATAPGEFADKESIGIDPETGRLFVAWTHFASATSMRVAYSDNAASGTPTWSAPIAVSARPVDGQSTSLATDPAGNGVYMVWESRPGTNLRAVSFARSNDNGLSWTPPAEITAPFGRPLCAYGFDRWGFSVSGNNLAVNPVDRALELVYAASVNGTPASDFADVYYQRSTNGGINWSAPLALNTNVGTGRPQVFPTLSAGNGRIDVYWYDESAGEGVSDLTDVFYTFSQDLGATWASPVPVTPSPFHNEIGNGFGGPHQGDYIDAFSNANAYGAFAWMTNPSPFTTAADPMVSVTSAHVQVATLRSRPGTLGISDQGCSANDGALVAGEIAQLSIPLENFGHAALAGIQATLSSTTPGVTIDPGVRSYPPLAPGASATSLNAYTIQLSSSYPCGQPIALRLDISAGGVAPTFVEIEIPTGVVTQNVLLLSESFDGVVAPALPAGWATVNVGTVSPNPWITTATSSASAPNAAFVVDQPVTTFARLEGPAVAVPAGADWLEITFKTSYDLEEADARFAYDGGSLDFQLNEMGGSRFITWPAVEFDHRYTHNVARASGNRAGDRSVWSGNSGGWKNVRVRLADMAGTLFQPHFDLTTDEEMGAPGWWVDDVEVRALTMGCGACTPASAGESPARLAFEIAGSNPFHGGTWLRYSLPAPGPVRIEAFGVDGRRVRTLVNGVKDAGSHTIAFDLAPAKLPPGVFMVRLTTGSEVRTLRVVGLE